jgi:osmoprotectant transport system substrate-binding protein
VFTVGGRILAVGLTTLTGNESLFPEFNAAVSIRKETFQRDSDIAGVLNPVAAKLTGKRHARCCTSRSPRKGSACPPTRLQRQGFIGT